MTTRAASKRSLVASHPIPPDSPTWTFLSNHTHVLFCISQNPELRTREIAQMVGITERAIQRIVADLVNEGYVIRNKRGRCNTYDLVSEAKLRHPLESDCTIGGLIKYLNKSSGRPNGGADTGTSSGTSPKGL